MRMERIIHLKKDDQNIEYYETGDGNDFRIGDIFGRNYDLPFTFGITEMYPSKGVEFGYDDDASICLCLEGTFNIENAKTGDVTRFEKDDLVYIPKEDGKIYIWSTLEYAKLAFVTYPHWR